MTSDVWASRRTDPIPRARQVVLGCALATGLLVSGCSGEESSPGRIVLDRSIGGVSLGEDRAAVESALGDGITLSSQIDRSARPEAIRAETVSYHDDELRVSYVSSESTGPTVVVVETRSPEYRTAAGIGVGSSIARIRSLPGTKCFDNSVCQHGYAAPNHAGTSFQLAPDSGEVGRIVISLGH